MISKKKSIVILLFCLMVVTVVPLPEQSEKNGPIKFVLGAIGQHLIGRAVDHVINHPPKLPPKSPDKDPSMPPGGGVIGGGRYGREF